LLKVSAIILEKATGKSSGTPGTFVWIKQIGMMTNNNTFSQSNRTALGSSVDQNVIPLEYCVNYISWYWKLSEKYAVSKKYGASCYSQLFSA